MKAFTVIFFCSWKFAATFPFAIYVMRMSFNETLFYTNAGGTIGTLFFVYFSGFIISLWNKLIGCRIRFFRKSKKIFTKRNRILVKIKTKFGLAGIIILSPVILSIPVGSFLTVKYYGIKKVNILFLIAGQVFWSVIYTLFYTQIKATF